MSMELEVVMFEGKPCIDSRIVAKQLGIEHEVLVYTIRKYQHRIEKYGSIRFQTGLKIGDRGGKRPIYIMLNENQSLFVGTLSRNSDEVIDFKDWLIEKFSEQREREQQQAQQNKRRGPNQLWDDRADLFYASVKVPHDYWTVFLESDMRHWSLKVRHLDLELEEGRLPDGSIGKRWKNYIVDKRYDLTLIKTYLHPYPDNRRDVEANCYPNAWLGNFRTWFADVYVPLYLPKYMEPRSKRLFLYGQQSLFLDSKP
ncbi:MAG: hypothetical protein NVS4B1_36610 [Ktedonobacteraceae bacterium]